MQLEIPEEGPIKQVFSQEPEDVRIVEPPIESEDQEKFEETAKFEGDRHSKSGAETRTKASKKIVDYKLHKLIKCLSHSLDFNIQHYKKLITYFAK